MFCFLFVAQSVMTQLVIAVIWFLVPWLELGGRGYLGSTAIYNGIGIGLAGFSRGPGGDGGFIG